MGAMGLLWIALCATLAEAADAPPGHAWAPQRTDRGDRAVLLLHDAGGAHADWGTLGPRLAAAGFRVLAPSLELPAADVKPAVDWLAARHPAELYLVGAGTGANLALLAATDDPRVSGVALLSPAPRAPGLELSRALERFDDRPVLVVAARGDLLAARAASFVRAGVRGDCRVELVDGAARGTHLLTAALGVEPLIVGWLEGGDRDHATPRTRASEVRTGRPGELKTQGVRLDERKR